MSATRPAIPKNLNPQTVRSYKNALRTYNAELLRRDPTQASAMRRNMSLIADSSKCRIIARHYVR